MLSLLIDEIFKLLFDLFLVDFDLKTSISVHTNGWTKFSTNKLKDEAYSHKVPLPKRTCSQIVGCGA
jgi:hypothetical protein